MLRKGRDNNSSYKKNFAKRWTIKPKFCKRGHERIPENLTASSGCIICERLLHTRAYKTRREGIQNKVDV